jgi:hypothetical protein
MFVQDSVRIERPLDVVIDTFERQVVPRLGDLVCDSWCEEADGEMESCVSRPVPVMIGPRRTRADGVVYAIAWRADGAPGLPEFDADLEFAALTPTKTHAELSGQSRFPSIEPWSSEERLAGRRGMAALARLMAAVALAIEVGTPVAT